MDKHEKAIKGGIASGLARQTPELTWQKSEAIRLHTQLDYGLAAIARAIGRPRNVARRFLIQAGVYKTGHRVSSRRYGFAPHSKGITDKTVALRQSQAWINEWKRAWKWDNEAHWIRHKAKGCYNCRYDKVAGYQRGYFNQPRTRLVRAMRLRTWKTITMQGGKKRMSWTRDLLGCDKAALISHLEQQFKPGMDWDNYGKVWEVDHIRPCASFNLADEDQQRQCFHYTNLQPLTVRENRTKQAKWTPTPTP